VFLAVRSFYLDLSQWSVEDPAIEEASKILRKTRASNGRALLPLTVLLQPGGAQ
jgi:hypothetical protein